MSDRDYYSKQNPNGPYEKFRARPHGSNDKPGDFIEGFSTKRNIDAWSARATENSFQHHGVGAKHHHPIKHEDGEPAGWAKHREK